MHIVIRRCSASKVQKVSMYEVFKTEIRSTHFQSYKILLDNIIVEIVVFYYGSTTLKVAI